MELVELKIQGITYSDNTSGAFALILQEINGAKEIGMTTVRFISDPDCNEADFKVVSFDDLLNLELSKV